MKKILIIVAVMLALVVGYLSWIKRTPVGEAGLSVTVETSGGFCPAPGCTPHTYVIAKNGVSTDGGAPAPISAADYQELSTLVIDVQDDDFPPKEEGRLCPSAYDASDVKYTFNTGTKIIRVDNCEDEVSADHPLIALIHELIYPQAE